MKTRATVLAAAMAVVVVLGIWLGGDNRGQHGRADVRQSARSPETAIDVGSGLAIVARAVPGNAEGVAPAGTRVAAVTFWIVSVLIGYTYVGYAGVVWVMARFMPLRVRLRAVTPTVSFVVVAHNEANRIGKRVRNLLSLDYPVAKREIIVISDGSTDETAARARAASPDVQVIERPAREGKAAAFNAVLPGLKSEVVVLTDARQRFDRHAAIALVRHFADPTVGAVSGDLVLRRRASAEAGSQGAEAYWDFEKRLRWWESLADSTVGVTGAITALRRELFEPIPVDTVLDDVLIPLRIARRGYRVTFETTARAYDRLSARGRDEFARKVRTLAGNFQLFAREPWLLLPWRNRLWVQTISHKVLRLALPVLFVVAALANVQLLDQPLYQATFGGQLAFYGMAVIGGIWPGLRRRVPIFVLPYAVCFLAWATIVAFVRVIRGRQHATWDRIAPVLK